MPAVPSLPAAERQLRGLFQRRDQLTRQMAEVDRRIASASTLYSDAAGYRCVPRPESIRRAVGL